MPVYIIDDWTLHREAMIPLIRGMLRREVRGAFNKMEEAIKTLSGLAEPIIVLYCVNDHPQKALAELKELAALESLRLVVISEFSSPVYVRQVVKIGAKAFLTRKSSIDDLTKALQLVEEGASYLSGDVADLLSASIMYAGGSIGYEALTSRELELLDSIREGLSSRQMAEKLSLSVKTVEAHRHHILKKMGVKNTAALLTTLAQKGL